LALKGAVPQEQPTIGDDQRRPGPRWPGHTPTKRENAFLFLHFSV